jgi:HSP20 family protein
MTEKNTKEKSRKQNGLDTKNSTALAIPSIGFPRIFEDFMKPFDEFMGPLLQTPNASIFSQFEEKAPRFDIQDRGDHYRLTAELPGFDKNDVEVRVTGNAIELKAEKRTEQSKKGKNGPTQSSYSSFHRYMSIPEPVLSEKVDGTMKNGVLELKLPKSEPKQRDVSRKVHLN